VLKAFREDADMARARLVGINHVALEVGDLDAALELYGRLFAFELRGRGLSFDDPWGNHFEVVEYGDVQFTKAPAVLRGMGLDGLGKTEAARRELADKGLA
jgi:catechol 2,3-dioxygenase-like lactoylglutathione lyase family enzyme